MRVGAGYRCGRGHGIPLTYSRIEALANDILKRAALLFQIVFVVCFCVVSHSRAPFARWILQTGFRTRWRLFIKRFFFLVESMGE